MKKSASIMIIIWSVIGVTILTMMVGGMTEKDSGTAFGYDMRLAVDEAVNVDGLKEINIKLASGECYIYLTEGSEIRVKHHVRNVNKDSYVKLDENGGSLTISNYPPTSFSFGIDLFGFFNRRSVIDIYLPKSYENALGISVASGSVDVGGDLRVSGLRIGVSSGRISSDYAVRSKRADIIVASGSVKLNGGLVSTDYSIDATSGTVAIDNLTGNGNIKLSSGTVKLNGVDIASILKAKVASGKLDIGIAGDPPIKLTGHKSSGTIKAYFPVYSSNGSIMATVGDEPFKNIDVSVTSGTVRITQE